MKSSILQNHINSLESHCKEIQSLYDQECTRSRDLGSKLGSSEAQISQLLHDKHTQSTSIQQLQAQLREASEEVNRLTLQVEDSERMNTTLRFEVPTESFEDLVLQAKDSMAPYLNEEMKSNRPDLITFNTKSRFNR